MSTLANTTWTVNYNNGGVMTVAFAASGAANIAFNNGSTASGSWAEAADGHFMFQLPKSTTNPNINEVFFGLHEAGEGSGHDCDISTSLRSFTMTRN